MIIRVDDIIKSVAKVVQICFLVSGIRVYGVPFVLGMSGHLGFSYRSSCIRDGALRGLLPLLLP